MIRRLTVSNFRSLGAGTVVDLGKLTAFVGPNGSGKSNVAGALQFMADAVRKGLESAITERHGIAAVRRWGAGRPYDVNLRVDLEATDFRGSYEFTLAGDRSEEYTVKREAAEVWTGDRAGEPSRFEVLNGRWERGPEGLRPSLSAGALALPLVAGDERFRVLADAIKSIEIYSVFPDTLREPQKFDGTRPMQRHGENWCSILRGLENEEWAPELKAALGKLTGDIDDVRITPVGGFLIAKFRHAADAGGEGRSRREKWLEADQESDGTLRVAGILTALLQQPPLTVVGVEEPELTVHPGALPLLYDFLSQASSRSQVLVTTHSPELLDLLDPEDVRVVRRDSGITTVSRLDPAQQAAARQQLLTLGELMRMEGLQQELPLGGDTE